MTSVPTRQLQLQQHQLQPSSSMAANLLQTRPMSTKASPLILHSEPRGSLSTSTTRTTAPPSVDDTIRGIFLRVSVVPNDNHESSSSSLSSEWIQGATQALWQSTTSRNQPDDDNDDDDDTSPNKATLQSDAETADNDKAAFLGALDEWMTVMTQLSQQSTMNHTTGTRKRKKGDVRKALQQHAQQLVYYQQQDNESQQEEDTARAVVAIRSVALGGVLMALALQAPYGQETREACRAVASAFGGVVQQQQPRKSRNRPSDDDAQPKQLSVSRDIGASILQELLLCQQPLDLHIVSLLGEAFQWPVDPKVACQAIEMEQNQQSTTSVPDLPTTTPNSSHDAAVIIPSHPTYSSKQSLAAILRFATYAQPWSHLSAASLMEPAAEWDLWHAAVKICQSVIQTQQQQPPPPQPSENSKGTECVAALIRCAVEAKRYRQADDYATQFYDHLVTPTLLIQARLLHAFSTIGKLIAKRQYQIIERQVLGVDQAVDRVLEDMGYTDDGSGNGESPLVISGIGDDDEGDTMEVAHVKDEIRTFALDHLVMANQVEAAQRLAQIWGRNVQYSPEALAKAREERKRTYLQWEDVLADHPIPELIDTPDLLKQAFEAIRAHHHPTSEGNASQGLVWGLDCEWDGEGGSGVALLQLATVQGGAVLIDVPALNNSSEGREALRATVGSLLSSGQDAVIGFHCHQDLSRLRQSCTLDSSPNQETPWIWETSAVLDLKQILMRNAAPGESLGLSKVCEQFMGKKLDKSEQCSAWSTRPLSVEQRIYGALDAYICAAVYEKTLVDE